MSQQPINKTVHRRLPPAVQSIWDWRKSIFDSAFWVRVGIYGGCTLSIGILAWQQNPFRWLQTDEGTYERALSRLIPLAEETIRDALSDQIRSYQVVGEFTPADQTDFPPEVRDRYHFVTWSTEPSQTQGAGPQQYLNEQLFPPPRDQQVVLTLDTEREHFIGIAYAVDEDTAAAHLCKSDRPFHPTEIKLVNKDGELSAQCPKGVFSYRIRE